MVDFEITIRLDCKEPLAYVAVLDRVNSFDASTMGENIVEETLPEDNPDLFYIARKITGSNTVT